MSPAPEDLEQMSYRQILEALHNRVDAIAREREQQVNRRRP